MPRCKCMMKAKVEKWRVLTRHEGSWCRSGKTKGLRSRWLPHSPAATPPSVSASPQIGAWCSHRGWVQHLSACCPHSCQKEKTTRVRPQEEQDCTVTGQLWANSTSKVQTSNVFNKIMAWWKFPATCPFYLFVCVFSPKFEKTHWISEILPNIFKSWNDKIVQNDYERTLFQSQ